eukprot:m.141293 g.141293  ORF g.141293 m.141293 type:complete len:487 (-) comp30177_c0_seq1:252-1712(-)
MVLSQRKAQPPTATTGKQNYVDPVTSLWPDGLAGISNQGIFKAIPGWVNASAPPGTTSQVEQLGFAKTVRTIVTLSHMIWSPNFVWLAIAVALHVFAPYDYAAAKEGFAVGWLLDRFFLNYAVAFIYYAFFYVGLYHLNLADRKFAPNSFPTVGNMAHNMYYWSLAIVQWTWWEAVMVRLWATGVVSFVTWEDMMADKQLLAINIAWIIIVPVWRDAHFYIAHRFLHIRSVYTYVHKLHHRNADPEPFSGMTMHPIEHLYYFSNAFTPSLYLGCLSPLVFTWNFIHLTIAPGAGHSGYEDHFQADQYHYVHHAKFECNYGSPMSGCVDQLLGTFREKLGASKVYTGEWNEKNDDNISAKTETKSKKEWSPHGYLGLPASWDHAVYTCFWVSLFPLVWYAATDPSKITDVVPGLTQLPVSFAQLVAIVVAYTPVPVAMLLSILSGDKMSWRWPFQKESVFGVFGVFLVFAWAACVLPVYHATLWTLQ